MSELALYRKYRSADFTQVVGQSAIISSLQSALQQGRTSHAYLFSGPRGVGKTTVARLLARSLNCTGTQKPCGTCETCQEALAGNLDIIEIDGASNRGIDEMRALREKIALAPARGGYKVYIIDEAHMLTEAAFNALLKTLEEPPAHAVFILATTEAHKIPATIASRAQHFQFTPFTTQQIIGRLQYIAKAEQITVDEDALRLVAELSQGGMRDAISLLDQLASGSEQVISVEQVRDLLGLGDEAHLSELVAAIEGGQAGAALEAIDQLKLAGIGPEQVAAQLIHGFRRQLAAQSTRTNTQAVHQLLDRIEALLPLGRSAWPEVALEAIILRMVVPTAGDPATTPVEAPPVIAQTPKIAVSSKPSQAQSGVVPAATHKPAGGMDELWLKTIARIKTQNNTLAAVLRSSSSCEATIEDDQVTLTCRFIFHRNRIEEPKNRQIIERCLDQVFGRKMRVVCQAESAIKSSSAPVTATSESGELVASALEILGGEVVYD